MYPLPRHLASAGLAFALVAGISAVSCQAAERDSGDDETPSASAEKKSSPPAGRPYRPGKPALAVKIDNVTAARPQTGLNRADIVYVEPVEAGLSRLLAVYASSLPRKTGPVRSARDSDLELLRQYGRPVFAFSGARTSLLPKIRRAPLHDVSPARAGNAYFRNGSRPAPDNLYARPHRLLDRVPNAAPPRDIGFRYGAAPPGGRRLESRSVSYRAFRATFSWSAKRSRWLVSMDGRPLRTVDRGRASASTVVVQYVDVRPRGPKDKHGNVSPYVTSTGSGRAVVLRDGKAYPARWKRPSPAVGTTFSTPSGKPMRFADGRVWVAFANRK